MADRPCFTASEERSIPPMTRSRRPKKPLDAQSLNDFALRYVARYATTQAKLERYLVRKLRERGWDGEGEPDPAALAEKFAERGWLDDEAYARMRSRDLMARGYGPRRVGEALREAGVDETIREDQQAGALESARSAVLLARKKRIGPFAVKEVDAALREKQLAAMLRAGHAFADARRVVDAQSEGELDAWLEELAEWED